MTVNITLTTKKELLFTIIFLFEITLITKKTLTPYINSFLNYCQVRQIFFEIGTLKGDKIRE